MNTAHDLTGHWVRDWIKAPGSEEHTTRVHWLQAETGLYADMRIPVERPNVAGFSRLADLPQPALAALLKAEGFAGRIDVVDSVCTWERQINLHGFPCPVDAGKMHWGPEGQLFEDGVHAEYREKWRAAPAEPLKASVHKLEDLTVFVVSNSKIFLVACGAANMPAQTELQGQLLAGTAASAQIAQAFQACFTYGHWRGANGIAGLSTNPLLEGQTVLTRTDDVLTWTHTSFDGARNTYDLLLPSLAKILP